MCFGTSALSITSFLLELMICSAMGQIRSQQWLEWRANLDSLHGRLHQTQLVIQVQFCFNYDLSKRIARYDEMKCLAEFEAFFGERTDFQWEGLSTLGVLQNHVNGQSLYVYLKQLHFLWIQSAKVYQSGYVHIHTHTQSMDINGFWCQFPLTSMIKITSFKDMDCFSLLESGAHSQNLVHKPY